MCGPVSQICGPVSKCSDIVQRSPLVSLKSSKVNSVNLMCDPVMRRKIGLGAFLSLCCLDLLDLTDPIVQGEGGNMCCVSFDNGDRGICDPSRPWCYSRVTPTVHGEC